MPWVVDCRIFDALWCDICGVGFMVCECVCGLSCCSLGICIWYLCLLGFGWNFGVDTYFFDLFGLFCNGLVA